MAEKSIKTATHAHFIKSSHYGFSAASILELGAAEYTLVTIAADMSGSVADFLQQIEDCIKEVVRACCLSPRADNLMLRVLRFDHELEEIHGFLPLSERNPDDYRGSLRAGGTTALYDAAHNALEAVTIYGKDLRDNDFEVNAIVFVITDGLDNASTLTAGSVKDALKRAVLSEALESVVSVLIGVNIHDPTVSRYLSQLHQQAGFSQYVEIENANSATLAKLADFVSRSISAQSSALGTGAGQILTF